MARPSFQLDIVSPEQQLYSGRVVSLTAPGVRGGFGVRARHAPMVAAIGAGQLTYTEAESGQTSSLAVGGGVVQVIPGSVTVLAEITPP